MYLLLHVSFLNLHSLSMYSRYLRLKHNRKFVFGQGNPYCVSCINYSIPLYENFTHKDLEKFMIREERIIYVWNLRADPIRRRLTPVSTRTIICKSWCQNMQSGSICFKKHHKQIVSAFLWTVFFPADNTASCAMWRKNAATGIWGSTCRFSDFRW